MSIESLRGHAAPSVKSINVECNLLLAWRQARAREEARLRKSLVAFGAAVVLGVCTVPPLTSALKHQQKLEAAAQSSVNALGKELTGLNAKRKESDPQVAVQDMVAKSTLKTTAFVGAFLRPLNRTARTMAISDIHIEIIGGDITIRGRADAETYQDGQRFVEEASRSSQVGSAILLSSRRANTLGAKGVSFEFLEKSTVKL